MQKFFTVLLISVSLIIVSCLIEDWTSKMARSLWSGILGGLKYGIWIPFIILYVYRKEGKNKK